MAMECENNVNTLELIPDLISKKVQNLFLTKQLMCSEAVLTVLNNSLGGGLTPEIAIRLTSGLPEGIGGSGCTCGALTGGVISLGLFLGRDQPGILNSKTIMLLAKELHDSFKNKFGSTCCRVLSKNYRHGSKKHFTMGTEIVGFSSKQTARIILREYPIRMDCIDRSYLEQRDSYGLSKIKNIIGCFVKSNRSNR